MNRQSTSKSIIKPFAQTHVEKYFRIAFGCKTEMENYVEKELTNTRKN